MYIRCVLDLNKKRPLDAGAARTDNKKLKLAGNVIHSYMCYIYSLYMLFISLPSLAWSTIYVYNRHIHEMQMK